jgi:hypothetical protein
MFFRNISNDLPDPRRQTHVLELRHLKCKGKLSQRQAGCRSSGRTVNVDVCACVRVLCCRHRLYTCDVVKSWYRGFEEHDMFRVICEFLVFCDYISKEEDIIDVDQDYLPCTPEMPQQEVSRATNITCLLLGTTALQQPWSPSVQTRVCVRYWPFASVSAILVLVNHSYMFQLSQSEPWRTQ